MASAEVHFYFDVVCPYAYLASTAIEELCQSTGATLRWRPILLGGVFRAIGTPDRPGDRLPEAKRRHTRLDLERWARVRGVPFAYPDAHPRRTVEAMRLLVEAGAAQPALAHALYRAYWAQGRDLADGAVLDEIAHQVGVDPRRRESAAAKAGLRLATDEAIAEGVFGVPAFVVVSGGVKRLFWGQDRLHFVARAVDGWEAPA